MRSAAAATLLAAVLAVPLGGCAGPARARLGEARRAAERARAQGAYRCAPEALARTEARIEFARVELAAGELMRAERQLDLAEEDARRALGGAAGCLAVETRAAAPPPAPLDSDGDGVLDRDDRCPTQPEDVDGWQDEDGCPDPDDDGDGVLDAEDRCPRLAGVASAHGCPDRDGDGIADAEDRCPDEPGVPEEAGCPTPKLIVVHADKIELKQKVHFASGKAAILPDSTPLLLEVLAALRKRPVRVRIEGHTDSRGSSALNTRLSRARAEAVRAWLVEHGIDGGRLAAVGFGPAQPIADNRTASGREENRRVELMLLGEAP